MIHADALEALPVRHAVPALVAALDEHGVAVLSAPPGTGKTTRITLRATATTQRCFPGAPASTRRPRRTAPGC
ncbi:hypothetical protein AB0K09_25505, partial [Streptomyces sp. NPDC049577]|uniref:hypothetical protein n=1 Tax=Streptomyces sp. NPDC049577 TaxID=3155153 RepID=UPI00341A7064